MLRSLVPRRSPIGDVGLGQVPGFVVSRLRPLLLVIAILAMSCSSAGDSADTDGGDSRGSPVPAVGEGPFDEAIVADLDILMRSLSDGPDIGVGLALEFDQNAVQRLGRSGDARVAWPLADLLRLLSRLESEAVLAALAELTGVEFGFPSWVTTTNQLLEWDLPAPPGYLQWKRVPFERVEPRWAAFFDDPDADFDYRLLHWGGVRLDGRSLAEARAGLRCAGCIPALDHPAVTDAAGGDWYPDYGFVFGIVVNGEARAYPQHIMEIHELVNDEIGGRIVGIPYCTLCGSAQAYFLDRPPEGFETLELRTSGLLSRSNKVMFDLHTFSAFDTFTGRAVSGPLREAGLVLEQISVVTSSWGEWKAEHPDTTIVAEDGGIDRIYPGDPLRGRDDDGPIFPIGLVDPRLPVHERVLGVEVPDGPPVAFPVEAARAALDAGREVRLGGVAIVAAAGGLRATDEDGAEVVSHEAFWFAWSQFQPETLLWQPIP